MYSDDVSLGSVNWELGMLLTPEHFLRQERYLDSRFLWLLRYASHSYGLIGGGPRLPETQRGADASDPAVYVHDEGDNVRVTVAQCRGITPGGCTVDISRSYPIDFEIAKDDLAGTADSRIYVVCEPHEKYAVEAESEHLNPRYEKERRMLYRLQLQLKAEEAPYAIAVGRMVRSRESTEFLLDAAFIPACTFMEAHSELAAGGRKIVNEVIQLASRYTELYRAMRQFITRYKDRGIEKDNDMDIMGFVGRMVVSLQNCVYEIVDLRQAPQNFFGHLRRVFHSSAVYLDLSPPVRQYFDLLKESGETGFMAILAQQKKAMDASPKWSIYEDLSLEVELARQSLESLARLERALEGKYIDFRVNPIMDAMDFFFDRAGDVLYVLSAKSSRVQGSDDMRTMTFARLQLEGKAEYRLILVGEEDAVFDQEIKVEIRLNEGAGNRARPKFVSCKPRYPDQRNFEFDFEAPDVPTINDVQVTLTADHPIKVGMLFIRRRFFASKEQEALKPLLREEKPREDAVRSDRLRDDRPPRDERPARDERPVREERFSRDDRPGDGRPPDSRGGDDRDRFPRTRLEPDRTRPPRFAEPPPPPPPPASPPRRPARDWDAPPSDRTARPFPRQDYRDDARDNDKSSRDWQPDDRTPPPSPTRRKRFQD